MRSNVTATFFLLTLISLGFARPAGAQSFLDRLEQRLQQIVPTTPDDQEQLAPDVGRPGYLGLVGDEVPDGGGVRIESLRPRGPAERAGLRVGDRIMELNGAPVRNLNDMARGLERQWVRSRLTFRIEREGEELEVGVVLGERPAERGGSPAGGATGGGPSLTPAAVPRPSPPDPLRPPQVADDLFLPPAAPPHLGATLAEVSTTLQRRYGLTTSAGAIVVDIEPGTSAAESRLLRGALITEINGRPIRHPQDVAALLEEASPGDTWNVKYLVRQQAYDTELVLAAAIPDELDLEPGQEPPPAINQGDADPLSLPPPPADERQRDAEPRGTPALDLAQRLNRDGRRPLLGRIGQVLDDLTAGDQARQGQPVPARPQPAPAPRRADESRPAEGSRPAADSSMAGELQSLATQVRRLSEEVSRLQKRLEMLEQRIVPREP